MRVPIDWLKELVKFKQTPQQLAGLLTMAGLETVVDGNLLEIDVLPNRSDCWSMRGIAREVAALTKFRIQPSAYRVMESTKKTNSVVKVEIKDRDLCPRYMARVVEGVTIGQSPDWLKKKLQSVGIRPINNVVDVTNYLLMEIGQPLHAFDAGYIAGNTIIVRRAKPGEKVKALDENEYELSKDMLVIADAEKPVAIAGIMGAANSEVRAETKTIILESAFFDRVSVHKTSQLLKLRSESSIRFERGVDWVGVEEALDRAAAMIAELAGGNILAGKVDKKARARVPKVVTLRPEKLNRLLGTNLSLSQMGKILKGLGFGVKGKRVSIPLFRAADVYREIDLIEEIARVHGYDRFSATMPNTSFAGKRIDELDIFHERVREIMAGCGLNESYTDSMVGPKEFARAGLEISKALKIENPLVAEQGYMRTMLIPNLLNVIQHNVSRQIADVFVFEIGKVFQPSNQKLPGETWTLCVAATGSPFESKLDKGEADYLYLKGIVENLFYSLGVAGQKFVETNHHLLQPGRAARVSDLGIIGELHPDTAKKYGFAKPVCFFEIDLDKLFKLTAKERKYKPLPKFPSVSRDIAMFVPKGLEHQAIVAAIRKAGGRLVEAVFLFDKYKDSLAYRVVYRDPARTLTDEEVNAKHEEITKIIESELSVRIRR